MASHCQTLFYPPLLLILSPFTPSYGATYAPLLLITCVTSKLVILPSAFTSDRNVAFVIAWPICAVACALSTALTVP
ncbi:MAG: hypothetical protein RML49_05680, partial [Verrucomicrobiae bacterium]|nr:hypothetical protein [Verrucomicrobiae bacterium]